MAPAETAQKQADSKPVEVKTQLVLEEDDEFEEFSSEDWSEAEANPADAKMWVDSWDDDATGDDFTAQLRQELSRK